MASISSSSFVPKLTLGLLLVTMDRQRRPSVRAQVGAQRVGRVLCVDKDEYLADGFGNLLEVGRHETFALLKL